MSGFALARRAAWVLAIAVIIGGMVCVFVPPCRHLRALQEQRQQLRDSNRETRLLIQELRIKTERFKTDPEFVERLARQSGLVKEDEVVFKFKE